MRPLCSTGAQNFTDCQRESEKAPTPEVAPSPWSRKSGSILAKSGTFPEISALQGLYYVAFVSRLSGQGENAETVQASDLRFCIHAEGRVTRESGKVPDFASRSRPKRDLAVHSGRRAPLPGRAPPHLPAERPQAGRARCPRRRRTEPAPIAAAGGRGRGGDARRGRNGLAATPPYGDLWRFRKSSRWRTKNRKGPADVLVRRPCLPLFRVAGRRPSPRRSRPGALRPRPRARRGAARLVILSGGREASRVEGPHWSRTPAAAAAIPGREPRMPSSPDAAPPPQGARDQGGPSTARRFRGAPLRMTGKRTSAAAAAIPGRKPRTPPDPHAAPNDASSRNWRDPSTARRRWRRSAQDDKGATAFRSAPLRMTGRRTSAAAAAIPGWEPRTPPGPDAAPDAASSRNQRDPSTSRRFRGAPLRMTRKAPPFTALAKKRGGGPCGPPPPHGARPAR